MYLRNGQVSVRKSSFSSLRLKRQKKSLQRGKNTLEAAYDAGLSGNGRLHDLFVKIEACTPGEYSKRGAGLEFKIAEIESPFGRLAIAESDRGISRLSFDSKSSLVDELRKEFTQAVIVDGLGSNGSRLDQYLKNWAYPVSPIKLDLWGSAFQIKVWKALLQIPSSQLLAYKDIAVMIGNPGANRAVGSAIGNNPVAYLIPCHRVIKGDGVMGNYRWGTNRKVVINGFEKAQLSD